MDSDSDESIVAHSMSSRRRVIVLEDDDSSSSSGEESSDKAVEIVDMDRVVVVGTSTSHCHDHDLFSEDSGSLEAMLKMLSLKKETDKAESVSKEEQSLGSSKSSSDYSTSSDGSDSKINRCPNVPDSAWSFDRQDQEYYLSKRKVPDVAWPSLRLPKHVFDSLYDHQKSAIQWMAHRHADRVGGILGDDMGM
jgi:SNF2 family DNA or RNA helicase